MRIFSNLVSKVSRMIKVDKLVKNEQIFKCCDQGELNDQSGQGEKKIGLFSNVVIKVWCMLCCAVR